MCNSCSDECSWCGAAYSVLLSICCQVSQFLQTLERDLQLGVGGRLDSVLGQCMYFGLSFSRVGADFRGLLAPIFERAALAGFTRAVNDANVRYCWSLLSTLPQACDSVGVCANVLQLWMASQILTL